MIKPVMKINSSDCLFLQLNSDCWFFSSSCRIGSAPALSPLLLPQILPFFVLWQLSFYNALNPLMKRIKNKSKAATFLFRPASVGFFGGYPLSKTKVWLLYLVFKWAPPTFPTLKPKAKPFNLLWLHSRALFNLPNISHVL